MAFPGLNKQLCLCSLIWNEIEDIGQLGIVSSFLFVNILGAGFRQLGITYTSQKVKKIKHWQFWMAPYPMKWACFLNLVLAYFQNDIVEKSSAVAIMNYMFPILSFSPCSYCSIVYSVYFRPWSSC